MASGPQGIGTTGEVETDTDRRVGVAERKGVADVWDQKRTENFDFISSRTSVRIITFQDMPVTVKRVNSR
ncbi:hypothetical protein NDU88_004422 [Pleurodeles waltl]|uniref:Uncharacterized protein n=1 Tax=Pleurodeles waltl TaxID=8319 RepID=A0AAV7MTE7_PLEWA|nr:hypothetical protein NDU88_004422 [Pleurodeles waltl]